MNYRRLHVWQAIGAVLMLGAAILKHGTLEQQSRFLPLIRAGGLRFCLGYSEPEAGSDLASLNTRAVRDGSDWIIDGQKLWTTGAHHAEWVWLAARTDSDVTPRHAGISVFLLPLATGGISIRQHRGLSGEISCTVTYDRVRVSDEARIGPVNGGWQVITDALMGERLILGSVAAALHRQLDDLLAAMRSHPERSGSPGSEKRALLGRVAAAVQAARVLVLAGVRAADSTAGARLHAPEAKVIAGEAAEALAQAALDILGPAALVHSEALGPCSGAVFDYYLRLSMMYVIGGGTNDVLRGQIARALGLPK